MHESNTVWIEILQALSLNFPLQNVQVLRDAVPTYLAPSQHRGSKASRTWSQKSMAFKGVGFSIGNRAIKDLSLSSAYRYPRFPPRCFDLPLPRASVQASTVSRFQLPTERKERSFTWRSRCCRLKFPQFPAKAPTRKYVRLLLLDTAACDSKMQVKDWGKNPFYKVPFWAWRTCAIDYNFLIGGPLVCGHWTAHLWDWRASANVTPECFELIGNEFLEGMATLTRCPLISGYSVFVTQYQESLNMKLLHQPH